MYGQPLDPHVDVRIQSCVWLWLLRILEEQYASQSRAARKESPKLTIHNRHGDVHQDETIKVVW